MKETLALRSDTWIQLLVATGENLESSVLAVMHCRV